MQTESIEWTCNNCGGTGKVKCPANKMEESILIVCSHCSTPSAYGWCAENGVGDEIVGIKFSEFPKTWQCTYCGSKHKFSEDFHETPITFIPRRFVDLKQLKLERDIRDQKYIPIWASTIFALWKKKRIYLLYVVLAIGILFFIAVGSVILFHLNVSLFPFVLLGASLPLMFLFFLFVETLEWLAQRVFLVIYKLKKFRE